MTTPPTPRDRQQLYADWVRYLTTYTTELTWFGVNSVIGAWGRATAGVVAVAQRMYASTLRRYSIASARDQWLTDAAREQGVERSVAAAAGALIVVQPIAANVASIVIAAAPGIDEIVVDDGSGFAVGDEIRIRNGAGTVTDVRTIASKPATNKMRVSTLTGTYTPGSDDVDVLFRTTLPIGTLVRATNGVTFALAESVTTSDANAVLDGESDALALADKAWATATTRGSAGNVDARSINRLAVAVDGVRAVFNPAPARGGFDELPDHELRYAVAYGPQQVAQETEAGIEALARAASLQVLRAWNVGGETLGTMRLYVVHRRSAFSASELTAIGSYVGARLRSGLTVEAINVTLTAIEVEGEITLEPETTLEAAWRAASAALSDLIDPSRATRGEYVEAALLLSTLRNSTGIASLDSSTFLPAADVVVGANSLPTFARLSLRDRTSGTTINAELAQTF